MDPEDLVIPARLYLSLKYYTWTYILTPLNPYIRDALLFLGLIKHEGRQNYVVGKISPTRNFEDLKSYLIETHGFEENFPAWIDDDEVFGLRYRENIYKQYHLRVYSDGEIRGHYEYAPECYPLHHIREIDMEFRRYKFVEFLSEWLEDKENITADALVEETANVTER